MSLETEATGIGEQKTESGVPVGNSSDSYTNSEQWSNFRKRIVSDTKDKPAQKLYGKWAERGDLHLWGVALAIGGEIDTSWRSLSKLASDVTLSKAKLRDVVKAAEAWVESEIDATASCTTAIEAVLWAAALPRLLDHCPDELWWRLLSRLQGTRDAVLVKLSSDAPEMALLGAELGLTMAWRLAAIPSCKRLSKSSMDCMTSWYKSDENSIARAVANGTNARLVFASLLRSRKIASKVSRVKFKKKQEDTLAELASWIACMTMHTGSSAFSAARRSDVREDVLPGGLLDQVVQCDTETLQPAMEAALGKSQSNGKLAWQVSLPSSLQHLEQAKLAVMMPEWDVRRGRVHVDYSGVNMHVEVFAGKHCVFEGANEISVRLNGQILRPLDSWGSICEYTDDDVHYLELEQPLTENYVVQRQLLVVRDDRCVLIGDSVLPSESRQNANPTDSLSYESRIPLTKTMHLRGESETREMFLNDGKDRGLIMPLSANEWRIGGSAASLCETDDQYLQLTTQGQRRLYAPLWFDFQRRRFGRKRTWRQLTVANDLRICDATEALGFRIQLGSEQWMLYRSLAERMPRTVMGRHLIADFYAGRFHAGDGSYEELITVDDGHEDE